MYVIFIALSDQSKILNKDLSNLHIILLRGLKFQHIFNFVVFMMYESWLLSKTKFAQCTTAHTVL